MFPFDLKVLKVGINDQVHCHSQLKFVPDQASNLHAEEDVDLKEEKQYLFVPETFILPEWQLDRRYIITTEQGKSKRARSHAVFQILLKRRYSYYMYKVWLISSLLPIWSWTTFFADPMNFPFRTSTALTLFLSLVAFLFVANGQLPKVPYLTLIDKLLVSNFFHLFLVGLECFFVFLLSNGNGTFYHMQNKDLAIKLDHISTILFPLAFVSFTMSMFLKAFYWRRSESDRTFENESCVADSPRHSRWSMHGIQSSTTGYVLVDAGAK
eukprot:TRINITY_DN48488_c0_g1_i1.p1 TRINITY_DN48488_c0_g1~~TRINITY_DN48488_c0_g1_i1.p1  ORF type:complete len:268 (-),score=55.50 TRINITY_DN48488_c0_g1_i1:57-860(-)